MKHLETRYDRFEISDGFVRARRSQNIDLDADEVLGTTLVLDADYNVASAALNLERSYIPPSPPVP